MSILDQSSHSNPKKKKKKDVVKEEEDVVESIRSSRDLNFEERTILDTFKVHRNRVGSRDVYIECSDRPSNDSVERES